MATKSIENNSNRFKQAWDITVFVILATLTTLVVVSICYTSYVVTAGTQGMIPKIMVVPQAFFAAAVVLSAFFLAIKNSINSK